MRTLHRAADRRITMASLPPKAAYLGLPKQFTKVAIFDDEPEGLAINNLILTGLRIPMFPKLLDIPMVTAELLKIHQENIRNTEYRFINVVPTPTKSFRSAIAILNQYIADPPEIVVTDLEFKQGNMVAQAGFMICEYIEKHFPETKVILSSTSRNHLREEVSKRNFYAAFSKGDGDRLAQCVVRAVRESEGITYH